MNFESILNDLIFKNKLQYQNYKFQISTNDQNSKQ
jgi:hypothetical protein